MGTPAIEGTGTWRAGIDQHTCWTMPFYSLVKKLTTEWAAIISVVLISIDFEFVRQPAVGRMDMLCSFFGFAALVIYVSLRETRFNRAVLLSNAAAAATA